jgi:hypothetical protein
MKMMELLALTPTPPGEGETKPVAGNYSGCGEKLARTSLRLFDGRAFPFEDLLLGEETGLKFGDIDFLEGLF